MTIVKSICALACNGEDCSRANRDEALAGTANKLCPNNATGSHRIGPDITTSPISLDSCENGLQGWG